MEYRTLGERIKAEREALGLLQSQVAERCDVKSAAVISQWECDVNKPDIDKLVKLCDLFKKTPTYMLGYTRDYSEDIAISQEERELLDKIRRFDEKSYGMVVAVVNSIDKYIDDYNAETKIADCYRTGAAGDKTAEIQQLFLSVFNPQYFEMKQKARELKALKKKARRSYEDITRYLWDYGYGGEICLAFVIDTINGIRVPNEKLYNVIKGYLTHNYTIKTTGYDDQAECP